MTAMTDEQKLAMIKAMLGIGDTTYDATLGVYLDSAKREILNWKYSYVGIPTSVTNVDIEDEMVQVNAVIAGWTIRGAEGQTVSIENGIHRHFSHADMVAYIRGNILPIARLG